MFSIHISTQPCLPSVEVTALVDRHLKLSLASLCSLVISVSISVITSHVEHSPKSVCHELHLVHFHAVAFCLNADDSQGLDQR